MTTGRLPAGRRESRARSMRARSKSSPSRSGDLQVRLRADSHADFRQWFYFRLQGARGQAVRIRFVNAGEATYLDGWRGLPGRRFYDRDDWFRVPTTFDGTSLRSRTSLRATASTTRISSRTRGNVISRCSAPPTLRRARARATSARRSKGATSTWSRSAKPAAAARIDLGDRAPASGRDDGRMVRGGNARALARPGRSRWRAACSSGR